LYFVATFKSLACVHVSFLQAFLDVTGNACHEPTIEKILVAHKIFEDAFGSTHSVKADLVRGNT
jgi:hypothetical protein